ncbi:hypothetical protein [Candidatus Magnetominusculus dajiuhuensis]|uniref:hypothetical protein n=1 Tax=Candidatus Magnetominusculus dajiuhuensis TaxID=3137712 RepID=UPI003B428205
MKTDSCEYINDFMYFIVKPGDGQALVYCSGVNITRFTPLTSGRHRLGQNIVMKGLQSSNLDLRSFILSLGAEPKTIRGGGCREEIHFSDALWNSESLLIENMPEDFSAVEVVRFSVKNFLRIVLPQCVPQGEIPEELLGPESLQAWLDSRCKS